MTGPEHLKRYIADPRTGQMFELDNSTAALPVIPYPHSEIHTGNSFTTHYSVDVSDTDFRTAITFKTANTTKWMHLIAQVSATQAAVAYIYEAVLIEGGTAGQPVAVAVYNRNRNSTETSGVISQHSTPVTGGVSGWTEALLQDANVGDDADWAVTTELELDSIPLGTSGNPLTSIGGLDRGTAEFVLDQNAVYMIMIQSADAEDNTHKIRLDWYEHTDKN